MLLAPLPRLARQFRYPCHRSPRYHPHPRYQRPHPRYQRPSPRYRPCPLQRLLQRHCRVLSPLRRPPAPQ